MIVLHHLHYLSLENRMNVPDELVLVLMGLCPRLSDLSVSEEVRRKETLRRLWEKNKARTDAGGPNDESKN
jgi:hypothetical protein